MPKKTIKMKKAEENNDGAYIPFKFKNSTVKKAAQMLALESDITVQQLIEDALKSKHPNLFKPNQ